MLSDEQINAIESRLNSSHMMDDDVVTLLDEVRRCRRIIAALRGAVERYADEDNWVDLDSRVKDVWLNAGDGYDTARDALAQVATIEGEARMPERRSFRVTESDIEVIVGGGCVRLRWLITYDRTYRAELVVGDASWVLLPHLTDLFDGMAALSRGRYGAIESTHVIDLLRRLGFEEETRDA